MYAAGGERQRGCVFTRADNNHADSYVANMNVSTQLKVDKITEKVNKGLAGHSQRTEMAACEPDCSDPSSTRAT